MIIVIIVFLAGGSWVLINGAGGRIYHF